MKSTGPHKIATFPFAPSNNHKTSKTDVGLDGIFLPLASDTDQHILPTDHRSCPLPRTLDDAWDVGTLMVVALFLRDDHVVSWEHALL